MVAAALGAAVVTFGAAVVGAAYSSGQSRLECIGLERQSSQRHLQGDIQHPVLTGRIREAKGLLRLQSLYISIN